MDFNTAMFDKVTWDMTGAQIENESFRRIEAECDGSDMSVRRWRVARRLIHTTADFSIIDTLRFRYDPITAVLTNLKLGVPLYSDSNMIKSGISIAKLRRFNADYNRDSIHCYIADSDVAQNARENGSTRALAAVRKAEKMLDGAIVLIGNAPLALATIVKLVVQNNIRPSVIIAMPVGFVNVVESKELLSCIDIPHVVLEGRRGGSPLAVATLHGIMESGGDDCLQ